MKGKQGAEMTVGTIVIIILALVVLVILIYGFSTGWSNLWQNIIGFGGGTVNVQTVISSCQVSCSTGATYDYCIKKREVVFESTKSERNNKFYTCKDLEFQNIGLSCDTIDCGEITDSTGCAKWGGTPKAPGTCNNLGGDYAELTFESLSNQGYVCCVSRKTCIEGWKGRWVLASPDACKPTNEFEITASNYDLVTSADKAAHPGMVCCAK